MSVTGSGSLRNFTNGGPLSLAANLPAPVLFSQFTNQGSGAITIGAGEHGHAADFQSYGTLTLNPAAVGSNQQTLLTNNGTSPIFFNGGSRTFIGTPQTATSGGQPTFVAGMDLEGKNLVIAGGLFVNNGFVSDFGSGAPGSIIVDFGALYKGAGFTGVNIVTQNGGRVQAGNSPGVAYNAVLTIGPGDSTLSIGRSTTQVRHQLSRQRPASAARLTSAESGERLEPRAGDYYTGPLGAPYDRQPDLDSVADGGKPVPVGIVHLAEPINSGSGELRSDGGLRPDATVRMADCHLRGKLLGTDGFGDVDRRHAIRHEPVSELDCTGSDVLATVCAESGRWRGDRLGLHAGAGTGLIDVGRFGRDRLGAVLAASMGR